MSHPTFPAMAARLLAFALTAFQCGAAVCAEAPRPVFDCGDFIVSLEWVPQSGSLLFGTYGEGTTDARVLMNEMFGNTKTAKRIGRISGLDREATCSVAIDMPDGCSPVGMSSLGNGHFFLRDTATSSTGGWVLSADDLSSRPVAYGLNDTVCTVAQRPDSPLGALGLGTGEVVLFKTSDLAGNRIIPVNRIQLGKTPIEHIVLLGDNALAAADWKGNLWRLAVEGGALRITSRYKLNRFPSTLLPIDGGRRLIVTDILSTQGLCLTVEGAAFVRPESFPLINGRHGIALPDNRAVLISDGGMSIWKFSPHPLKIATYKFNEGANDLAFAPEKKCLFVGTSCGPIYSLQIP